MGVSRRHQGFSTLVGIAGVILCVMVFAVAHDVDTHEVTSSASVTADSEMTPHIEALCGLLVVINLMVALARAQRGTVTVRVLRHVARRWEPVSTRERDGPVLFANHDFVPVLA